MIHSLIMLLQLVPVLVWKNISIARLLILRSVKHNEFSLDHPPVLIRRLFIASFRSIRKVMKELPFIFPNSANFINLKTPRFSKTGKLEFYSTQSIPPTSSETISSHPNSCWLSIWMIFIPCSKNGATNPRGSCTELSSDSMTLFDRGLSCIEILYPHASVSVFHIKLISFPLWLLGFSNFFRLTFFLTCSLEIACTSSTLLLINFVKLKHPAAHNPLTLKIRSIAASTSGDDFSI